VRGGETRYFQGKCVNITRQILLTAAAITSNKSLTCLQLVLPSNWSNFRHAFASRVLCQRQLRFLVSIVRKMFYDMCIVIMRVYFLDEVIQ